MNPTTPYIPSSSPYTGTGAAGASMKTNNGLVQKTLAAPTQTATLRALAAQHPDVASLVNLVESQKANIAAAQSNAAPTGVSSDVAGGSIPVQRRTQTDMSFGERAITVSFGATTTTKIFFDGNGLNAAITGFANGNSAFVTGGSFGAASGTIVGAQSIGNPLHLTKIICQKLDSNFALVTCKANQADLDGGQKVVPLNFSKGLSPYNFDTAVLQFPLNMIVDGMFALSVNTGAATDFSVTLIVNEQTKSYNFQNV